MFLGMWTAVVVVSPAAVAGGHGAGPPIRAIGPPASAHLTSVAMRGPARPPIESVSVSPSSVPANSTTTLIFTFTAATPFDGGEVILTVPADWTPPSVTPGSPGYVTSPCTGSEPCVAVNGMNVMVSGVNLAAESAITLTYEDARAPGRQTVDSFLASARPLPYGHLLPVSPADVSVSCPAGSMSASPHAVTAGSTSTLIFTYRAGSCGIGAGGQLSLVIPSGWTPPSLTGPAGDITVSRFSPPSLSGSTITITVPQEGDVLAPGETLTITYATAVAPGSPGPFTFSTSEQTSASSTLTLLTDSPQVTVAPPEPSSRGTSNGGTASPASSGSPASPAAEQGRMTVTPGTVTAGRSATLTFTYTAGADGLRPQGEVGLMVPQGWPAPPGGIATAEHPTTSAGMLTVSGRRITVNNVKLAPGQQLVITYRTRSVPHSPGRFTFAAQERSSGSARLMALAASPSVVVAAGAGSVPLAVIGAVAALVVIAAGATFAVRYLRGRGGPLPSVAAEPHTGPPPAMTIRDTGGDPALTVHIEPHPAAPRTHVEEARP